MSASISHEIKNVLAIINESAGLLEDLTVMAEKGMPIDQERLKNHAGKIVKQIRRADGIVQNMNNFAHSVDEFKKGVDLSEITDLVSALSARFASIRGVTVELLIPEGPVMITTSPFFLENLIWLCFDFAMDVAGENKTVGLSVEETQDGARMRFTRLDGLTEAPEDRFPTERERALLEMLGGELEVEVGAGKLAIILPKDMGR
jgi:signal transduction histidine kinase